jgi:hypothetical protein
VVVPHAPELLALREEDVGDVRCWEPGPRNVTIPRKPAAYIRERNG